MTSLVPSNTLKEFLAQASVTYEAAMKGNDAAVQYLMNRGLNGDSAHYFRLGIVERPLAGHEKYEGMLAVPYWTRAGCVDIRFRCIRPECVEIGKCLEHPKFRSLPGSQPRPYNVNALHVDSPFICITEGEPDTWTAHQARLPTVGFPGVSSWRGYCHRLFVGYDDVFILADNDDKGQGAEFGEKIAAKVPNARVVLMPKGHDVNSFVLEQGPDALRERILK